MTKSSAHAVLSTELDGVECHTPHAVRSGDTAWAVWQGYQQDKEHIYARASHGGELTPLEEVTSKGRQEPLTLHRPGQGCAEQRLDFPRSMVNLCSVRIYTIYFRLGNAAKAWE